MTVISLTDEFVEPSGRFLNYDVYDSTQRIAIRNLKHRDIRTFRQNDIVTPNTVQALSVNTMTQLSAQTVGQISGGNVIVTSGEHWTAGTVASDSTVDHFLTLALTCPIGTTTTVSDMPTAPVNLVDSFSDTDYLSIAFPNFPSTSLNLGSSTVGFSDVNGNTKTLALNSSTIALINGNSEFRVLLSTLRTGGTDFSAITKITFTFVATGSCTVRVSALRIMSKDWSVGGLDTDTRYGFLRRTPSRTGSVALAPEFTQPILWKASSPPGFEDPRPIDAEIAVLFTTGTSTLTNSFTLYFREQTEDFLTQLDLNGLVQGKLDGHEQPDLGDSQYNSRIQTDLDPFTQDQLDSISQFDLERTPDFLSASWIQFVCQWTPSTGTVTIVDTEGNGYTLPVTLAANQSYVFFALLEENSVRATIYTLDTANNVGTLVFDSSRLTDDNAFKRRKGRFGWYADLRDGDTFIDAIEARSLNFAEYRSKPLESNTPIIGAELFTSNSPNLEHFDYFTPGPFNTNVNSLIARDTDRSTSGESWKVTDYGTSNLQGLATNAMEITDLANTEIQFDLFYPLSTGLSAQLQSYDGLRVIPLLMPVIAPNQWQRIRILLPATQRVLSGSYKFVLMQTVRSAITWWIDSPTIFSRSVVWEGRAEVDNPWQSNDAGWTPFRNTLSRSSGGVIFPHRGRQLQIRGRGLYQDASISRVQFLPKYAELGRFAPADTSPHVGPTAAFTTSALGSNSIRFTDTSTDADGYIALSEWNFGDGGVGIGKIVTHQYASAGSYSVTLTTVDNNGNRATQTSIVAV